MNKTMFLDRLREYISRTDGVTATSLALKAGMANTTIRNWFDGRASPSMNSAEKVLAAIGMDYAEFMREDAPTDESEILALWNRLTPEEQRYLKASAKALIADHRGEEPQ